jgi:uncharacterized protein YdeI (YjbR/CyaY-like superfamily)
MPDMPEPTFFASQSEFRQWLEKNHDTAKELWVGYYKKGTGLPSLTWPESVDEALCFGWIDGVRKRIDDTSYTNRFTPRKPASAWSAVNVKRAQELTDLGLMHEAGRKAFEKREDKKTSLYSYENRPAELPEEYAKVFRANKKAWEFFQSQSPSYRRTCIWWVVSAKQEQTRQKRLTTLIADSEKGEKTGIFNR